MTPEEPRDDLGRPLRLHMGNDASSYAATMHPRRYLTTLAWTGLLAGLLCHRVYGHEHDAEDIPEGQPISEDPIVRRTLRPPHFIPSMDGPRQCEAMLIVMREIAGYDLMDSHRRSDPSLWYHLPDRDGSGGEYADTSQLEATSELSFPMTHQTGGGRTRNVEFE